MHVNISARMDCRVFIQRGYGITQKLKRSNLPKRSPSQIWYPHGGVNYNILIFYYDFCFLSVKMCTPHGVFSNFNYVNTTRMSGSKISCFYYCYRHSISWFCVFQIFHTIICGYFECHHRWPSTGCQSINDVFIGIFIRYSYNTTTPYYFINGPGLQLFKSVYNENNIILYRWGVERIYWEWSTRVLCCNGF